jgi:hypothetical protein
MLVSSRRAVSQLKSAASSRYRLEIPHCRGVSGYIPATAQETQKIQPKIRQEHFGAAMLGFGDDRGLRAQALVTEPGRSNADP